MLDYCNLQVYNLQIRDSQNLCLILNDILSFKKNVQLAAKLYDSVNKTVTYWNPAINVYNLIELQFLNMLLLIKQGLSCSSLKS